MDGPGDHIVIFHGRRAAACHERALVLKAMNIEHAVVRRAGEWLLVVPEGRAQVAVRELDHYARENDGWPGRRPTPVYHPLGLGGVVGCVVILLAVAAADGNLTFGVDWFDAGRVDTDLVRRGELWRTVTGLTLHVSVGHLVGNVLLGSVFGLIAGRVFGGGLAWFSIVLAGAVGNAVSAVVQLAPHSAVGASTAVFAALGLIAAYAWQRRTKLPSRWAFRWAPIIVAAVVLAWTGSGGARTDVIAHLTGFLAGIALGAIYGRVGAGIVLGAWSQRLLGACAVALLAGAWAIALLSYG